MSVPTEENLKVLWCILPKGEGLPILQDLHEEGFHRADMHSARTRVEPDSGGLLTWVEKDVLTLVTSEAKADHLFERLYDRVGVDEAPGSIIYVARTSRATPFALPAGVPAEEATP